MELETITMERQQAREAFLDYRRAVRSTARARLDDAQRDYEEIDRAVMRAYKELAAGRQLLRLTDTLRAGGFLGFDVPRVGWTTDGRRKDYTSTLTLPRLAVCRADARRVFTRGVDNDGGLIFRADDRRSDRRADKLVIPDGSFESAGPVDWGAWASAIVPTIPPTFRPPHKLSGYHLLWEAEWGNAAPEDPALLRCLGGDLYVVLAVWDLTPLEQAVLAGQRAE